MATLLIDGHFLLKRSYLINKNTTNFKNSGSLIAYTFLTTIRKLVKDFSYVNKIFVAWDGINSGKIRYDFYPAYKANRESKSWFAKKQYLSQVDVNRINRDKKELVYHKQKISSYLEEFFIRQYEIDFVEADDIIAFYCKEKYKDENILIFSGDGDYIQLLAYGDNIGVILANNFTEYLNNNSLKKDYNIINYSNFNKTFQYKVENAPVIKAFLGDSSDNVSGIRLLSEIVLLNLVPELKTNILSLDEAYNILISKAKEKKNIKSKYIINGITNQMYNYLKTNISIYRDGNHIFLNFQNKTRYKIVDIDKYQNNGIFEKKDSYTADEFLNIVDYNFDSDDIIWKHIKKYLDGDKILYGKKVIDLNFKLMNLLSADTLIPTKDIDGLKLNIHGVLEHIADGKEIRGGKFALAMMKDDLFLTHYNINENIVQKFITYSEPFLQIIKHEKQKQ